MKLLIVTQRVDRQDSNLGFFHDWIKEFAKHSEKVIVICLNEGEHSLPENVEVMSLGKEKSGKSFFNRYLYICRFYRLVWQKRKAYDSVFVHMNSEYVVLAGWFWKLTKKKMSVWFTHGSKPMSLRIAEKFVDNIFTASKASCPLESKKIKVMGHGIDLERYRVSPKDSCQKKDNFFKMITVGRISPSKDYETLIGAVEILRKKQVDNFLVEVVGGAGTPEQEEYFSQIKKEVKEKHLENFIKFTGPVPAGDIPTKLCQSDLFVHMSQTGSLDKAVLEAMASGVIVVSNNKAVKEDVLFDFRKKLCYDVGDKLMLAVRITGVMEMDGDVRRGVGGEMRGIVEKGHGLKGLIKRIVEKIQ